MPLQPNALCSVAAVRDELPIGAERALGDWQARIEAAINVASDLLDARVRHGDPWPSPLPAAVAMACARLSVHVLEERNRHRARPASDADAAGPDVDPVIGLPCEIVALIEDLRVLPAAHVVPGL